MSGWPWPSGADYLFKDERDNILKELKKGTLDKDLLKKLIRNFWEVLMQDFHTNRDNYKKLHIAPLFVSNSLADAICSTEKGGTTSPSYCFFILSYSASLHCMVRVWNGIEDAESTESMEQYMNRLSVRLSVLKLDHDFSKKTEPRPWGSKEGYGKAEKGPPRSGKWVFDESGRKVD